MGIRGRIRRDSKHRVLRAGESMRADGKYQFDHEYGRRYSSDRNY